MLYKYIKTTYEKSHWLDKKKSNLRGSKFAVQTDTNIRNNPKK